MLKRVEAAPTGNFAQVFVDPAGLHCRENHNYAAVDVGVGHSQLSKLLTVRCKSCPAQEDRNLGGARHRGYFGAFFVTRPTAFPADTASLLNSALLSAAAWLSWSRTTRSLAAAL